MLVYAKEKWAENSDRLKKVIAEIPKEERMRWDYEDIIKLIIDNILNPGSQPIGWHRWSNDIHEINDGNYQGTLIYLIHRLCYQPSAYDYLITYVDYGSCSGCDALQGIQSDDFFEGRDPVNDYMSLCKDIVTNLKHPFNSYNAMEEAEVDE